MRAPALSSQLNQSAPKLVVRYAINCAGFLAPSGKNNPVGEPFRQRCPTDVYHGVQHGNQKRKPGRQVLDRALSAEEILSRA
jgi:hypothetical protein